MSVTTLVTDVMPDLLPMQNRSSGLHISGIIQDWCYAAKLLDPNRTDMSTAYMQLGKIFEYAWVQMKIADEPGRYIQVGEITYDGIHLTMDLWDIVLEEVVELKVTWKSAHNADPDDTKFLRYWMQIMAYCEAMQTLRGRLVVCFVIGDYKGDEPKYRDWRRVFTRQELAENWMMLKRHGEENRERLEERHG